ncbi:VWA domain-containing protein [Sphingomonas sp. AP4-R1]|uniref:VWA domain-containing protein n=1 Tax=Sphingomonas sp. AP4-R1 TaxID=2735134 RepID=UPI001493B9A1|nr:VWA domain-containing protein [Sphingomonas sp. AP4-R1]QJU57994.1 VWA domain-containing protein [Sphingomonas sp. AP4-R1]
MSFAAPWFLLLALLPLALSFLMARREGTGEALPAVLRAVAAGGRLRIGGRGIGRPWRFWCALLLLVVALARPQYGAKPDAADTRPQVMIALDLSRSMTATDALPSRLERARTIATRFVAQSPGADIGLIAFAGQAYPLAAPSADRALLRFFLPSLMPDQMVVPGSNFASLLDVAQHSFGAKAVSRTLVILSDGEAEPTPWRPILPKLRAAGVHVVAVGLGTTAGAHIRSGGRDLIGPSGTAVVSRLDTDAMRAIANGTGGAYLDAAKSRDLSARVQALADADAAAAATAAPKPGEAKQDRFGWVLVPGLLLLLWSALVEWPALPRLLRAPRHWQRPAAYASLAVLAVGLAGPRGQAVKPPPISLELHGTEPDPLLVVKDRTRKVLAEGQATAEDYMALAQAAVRYGEVHRQHAHVLQDGVMRDGLVAIDAGEAIDPRMAGWADARAKLIHLLRPPKPVNNPDKGAPDPANDPVDAKLNMPQPVPGEDQDKKDGKDSGKKADQDSRKVGGTQRSKAEEAEWRVPSLVKPLYALQKLRGSDRPGELFRLMQIQQPGPPRKGGQTW